MGSGITYVFCITSIFQLYIYILEERKPHPFNSLQGGGAMAAIRQKLNKTFLDGKISNKDKFEFLNLIESGKLSKYELTKELMFLDLIDAMPT